MTEFLPMPEDGKGPSGIQFTKQLDLAFVAELNDYVNACARALNLSHWQVEVLPWLGELSSEAATYCTRDLEAFITFAHLEYSPEQFRTLVCHELTHIILHDLSDVAQAAVDQTMGEVGQAMLEDALEQSVEWFARLLSPRLPLPDASMVGTMSRGIFWALNTATEPTP